jgi:hypothetical protein
MHAIVHRDECGTEQDGLQQLVLQKLPLQVVVYEPLGPFATDMPPPTALATHARTHPSHA